MVSIGFISQFFVPYFVSKKDLKSLSLRLKIQGKLSEKRGENANI